MDKKHIYKFDMAIILVSLFALIFIVGYSRPLVIAPIDNFETTENEILFEIGNAETLIIDDNLDFTTPMQYEVKDGLKLNLEPGTYYWKAVGVLGSEVRMLTINSKVSLELRSLGEGEFEVVNNGNVRLNVQVYDGGELVEEKKVGIGNFVDGGNKFVGREDEA